MADPNLHVVAQPTRYEVCALPENHDLYDLYVVVVEYRGQGLWAVRRHGRWCLDADGVWQHAPGIFADDELRARHRFDISEALRLAVEAAPNVTVSGRSAADVLNAGEGGPS